MYLLYVGVNTLIQVYLLYCICRKQVGHCHDKIGRVSYSVYYHERSLHQILLTDVAPTEGTRTSRLNKSVSWDALISEKVATNSSRSSNSLHSPEYTAIATARPKNVAAHTSPSATCCEDRLIICNE